ncbi:oxidase ustYa family protein, partial [Aspergillus ibericus CBS 121593]
SSQTANKSQEKPGPLTNPANIHPIRVNGTYNAPSPYRGPPTPEVDAAWEEYWKVWMVGIDEETFQASNPQYPEASVRLEESGQYLATLEATHQLHCLYNLFRASYLDVYQDERAEYEKDPRNWHERVDHCVEILRQKLECDRDTGLITYNWVRGKKVPTANFNVQRMCPEWGVMDRWAVQRQVSELPTKPSNAVQLSFIP